MTKKFIYLLFKDGEGGEPKEPKIDEGSEGKGLGEGGEGKEPENEPKSEPKKQTKKTEKKVSITAKEFEEYKQFKLNSMSADERENALKEENESLLTKIGVLENTIETQTKEIERVKAQDSIKEKLGTIKSEKPYLIETLDKRASKGFNSVDEVNEFVNLIDSPTLKEAYDVLQKTQKATKITSKNIVGASNNDNNTNNTRYSNYDLSKYGIRVRK